VPTPIPIAALSRGFVLNCLSYIKYTLALRLKPLIYLDTLSAVPFQKLEASCIIKWSAGRLPNFEEIEGFVCEIAMVEMAHANRIAKSFLIISS